MQASALQRQPAKFVAAIGKVYEACSMHYVDTPLKEEIGPRLVGLGWYCDRSNFQLKSCLGATCGFVFDYSVYFLSFRATSD